MTIPLYNYVFLFFFLPVLNFSHYSTNAQPSGFSSSQQDSLWWKTQAAEMVKEQIVSRGIKDARVIEVMKNTPRHLFVPAESQSLAYNDYPLSIGEEQTISQPYIVAIMTELLQLKGNEKVLEIGTGSAYQAAILSQLCKQVFTIEIVKSLADSAKIRLQKLGYKNTKVILGDGYKGLPDYAPFDCIIVTAAPEEVPEELVKQLKTGGRMVVPVGKTTQDLILITKDKDGIKQEKIIGVRFVPMIKKEKEK